jgi:hypothetical protein
MLVVSCGKVCEGCDIALEGKDQLIETRKEVNKDPA